MAIRKDHVHDTVLYPSAYIRIERFDAGSKDMFDPSKANMHCWASIYADKPEAGVQPICATNVRFDYDMNSQDNLWKQAYEAMKAMPEWQDASDDI